MVIGISSSASYTISTPVYEGPLDLLLQLIERAELDITRLALAQVTDQFLSYLHEMPESTAADVSPFIVIASKLIQIKSEALLPRPPIREPGEEDPGDALARQLRLYKRFKQISTLLAERAALGHTFPRIAPMPHIEPGLDLHGLTVNDLFLAAQFILGQDKSLPTLDMVVSAPRYTIREKISQIARYLHLHPRGTFDQLLGDRSRRLEIVVTFLALLELVRRHMVQTNQENLFGSIAFEPDSAWEDDLSFDLEFGE
jgi:segregation and condensation protein A